MGVFRPISHFISKTVQDTTTMEEEWELVCYLSNGTASSDLQ